MRDYNGDGISFQQSNDVRVEQCVVERCAGLGLHPGSGSQRPVVTGCRAVGNGGDGLFFCWRVRGGVAEGNWLEGNAGHGVSLGHKDSDNFIRRNVIEDSGVGRQKVAIRIGSRAGKVILEGNTLKAAHEVQDERPSVPSADFRSDGEGKVGQRRPRQVHQ